MSDLAAFLDPALVLPVRGRGVRIPPPNAWDGLAWRLRLLELDGQPLPAQEERAAIRTILGTQFDELYTWLDHTSLLHVGRAALLHWCGSAELALRLWNSEPAPPIVVDESAPGYLDPTDPGGGPIIPGTGMREWYNTPSAAPKPPASTSVELSWRDVLDQWSAIELDIATQFGVELTPDFLRSKPWTWLDARIHDLLLTPGTRLNRAVSALARSK